MAAGRDRTLWMLLAVLLLVRLADVSVYPLLAQHMPSWAWSNNDGYDVIAVNWVETGLYSLNPGIPTAARLPLYPGIIALAYLVAGVAFPTVVMLFQALLSTATGFVLFRLTQDLFGRRSALITLVLFTFHPQVNNFIFRCATETVFIFLVTMLLYSVLKYLGGNRLGDLVWSAVWLALSLLTRQTLAHLALLSVPLFLPWRVRSPHALMTRTGHLAAAGLTVALILAPWLARNYARSGCVPVLQTWVGQPLYQGTYVSSRLSEFLCHRKSVSELDQEALSLSQGAVKSFLTRQATDGRPIAQEVLADHHARSLAGRRIRERPLESLRLFLRNLWLAPVLQMTWGSTVVLMLWNWPLLGLCALGAVMCFITRRPAFVAALPVTILFCYVLAVHALVWPQARYILPALVPFSGFAGFCLAGVSPGGRPNQTTRLLRMTCWYQR